MAFLKLCIALLVFLTLPISCIQDQTVISSNHYNEHKCQHFGSTLNIPDVTVNFAHYIPGGTIIELDQDHGLLWCGWKTQKTEKDMCRVAVYVATSHRSGITLEAWLPNEDEWTGRFLSTGNGGNSGCIRYPDLAYATSLGFATVGKWNLSPFGQSKAEVLVPGANNGHNGTGGSVSPVDLHQYMNFRAYMI